MTKTEAKNLIKSEGLYSALYELMYSRGDSNLLEKIEQVLDNIDSETIAQAIRKLH